jgi:hypothetical protein
MGKSWVRCWNVEAGSRVHHDVAGTENIFEVHGVSDGVTGKTENSY